MIDMAQAKTEAVFEFARNLATAKAPSDLVELWTAHAQKPKKQFEMLSQRIKELTALGQKFAGESAEPVARGVNQAFGGARFAADGLRPVRCAPRIEDHPRPYGPEPALCHLARR
jgi:hypothetical protein